MYKYTNENSVIVEQWGEINLMKGYKYKIWVKQGIKESRKHYKSIWNRKIRHNNGLVYNNCNYKKLAGYSIYKYVS